MPSNLEEKQKVDDSNINVPTTPLPSPGHPPTTILIIFFILLAVIATGLGIYAVLRLSGKKETGNDRGRVFTRMQVSPTPLGMTALTFTPAPTRRPTPLPIPYEKQVAKWSHGEDVKGPKPVEVIIDPFDPKIGEKQTYTVKIMYDIPVTSAILILNTDTKNTRYPLKLIDGTLTQGTWQSTITTEDTHDYVYYPVFELKSSRDTFKSGLSIR